MVLQVSQYQLCYRTKIGHVILLSGLNKICNPLYCLAHVCVGVTVVTVSFFSFSLSLTVLEFKFSLCGVD